MFCTKCGEKIPDLSKFCTKCGKKIKAEADAKNGGKPRRFRALKITGLFAVVFAVLVAIPLIGYLVARVQVETYKHPSAGFSVVYPKSLKVEIPPLPPSSTCKTAIPCFVVFKNPSYGDYAVNWIVVLSATDAGMKKEKFVNEGTKAFQVDVDRGEATVLTFGDKKVYKYENDPAKPSQTMAEIAKSFSLVPSSVKTLYAFFSGDSAVMIFFQAPPPGAPADYGSYLNIKSLIAPN